MEILKAKRYIVKGDVQGVGYRYFAVRVAQRLGVKGFVRNLPNGDVEAYAEAAEKNLEEFRRDLLKGPMMSHVTEVIVSEEQSKGTFNSFEIRY